MTENKPDQSRVDFKALKQGGFIKQKQGDFFVVRIKVLAGNATPAQLRKVAELSEKYGRGYAHLSVRQGIEVPFVRLEDFNVFKDELSKVGLEMGACGPRVRVVVACPGNLVCHHAVADTLKFTERLDQEFYGKGGLPHKFKIGVTGCPNSCAKPQENDVGFVGAAEPIFDESEDECINCGLCEENCPTGAIKIVDGKPVIDENKCSYDGKCVLLCPTEVLKGKRAGWSIYVGGKWGRKPQIGRLLEKLVSQDRAIELTRRVKNTFIDQAQKGERLGEMINRVGFERFKEEVLGG